MFRPTTPTINFPDLEKQILKYWQEKGIVKKYLLKNRNSAERFSFLDGPITANNPMGVHHAWGRTYKDLWQKFNTMWGKKQRYQNGFDCQGLWVEVEVEKELGFKNKKEIEKYGIDKFVKKCKERVIKYAKIQTEQSKRLGYFMDWDNSYFTMNSENNYMIWYFLKKCFEKGWIYKGKDSVPWCPRCETAISQHEILTEDYKEVVHESVYLKFPLIDRNESILVWTTTPWTILANIAVAVDEDLDYALVKDQQNNFLWLAKETIPRVFKDQKITIEKTVKGSFLVGLRYKTAFDDLPAVQKVKKTWPEKIHLVIATDKQIMPIVISEGTGLVHTAVSAGTEDFKLGKKLGLPMIPVINDDASYLPELGLFSGKNAKENPRLILDYLVAKGNTWFLKIEDYKHRYPVCWRCKTELVWKVTDEWYIAMDKPSPTSGKTFRQIMIEVAKKIKWLPAFGLERELDWLTHMGDWLISKKNRYWGLALPIYECQKCGNFEVIGSREELKKKAVAGWDKFVGHSPHRPWIDEVKISCQKCGNVISRIKDVGNPWLDAGIVPFSTITENNQGLPLYKKDRDKWRLWYPVDFITESFPGQFKNWFYALIAMSSALENEAPFKTVLGFATLLAEDGRPMHKSWGNMIEFNEGAEKIGVDVMRWMYARQNPQNNLLFGYKVADEVRRKFHLILWNTYNFFVTYANLYHFDPRLYRRKTSKYILDRWIISRLNNLIFKVTESLQNYDAYNAALEIENFVEDLSTWFVRRSRNRINTKDCLFTLYQVLVSLAKILAPFLPFLSEEIFTNLTNKESVHLAKWPEASLSFIDSDLENEMKDLRFLAQVFHSLRKTKNVKLRIPVIKAIYKRRIRFSLDLEKILAEELNIRELVYQKILTEKEENEPWQVSFNPHNLDLTEGEAREIIRQVQQLRKKQNLHLTDRIILTLPSWPVKYEQLIKLKTLSVQIKRGPTIKIEKFF